MKQLVEYMKESLATNSPFALNEDRDQTIDSISRKLNHSLISEDSDETIRLNDFEAIWKVKDPENRKGIFVIEVPEDYTDDDINQYISDLLLESMPSDDDLAKEYFGANADNIIDARFEFEKKEDAKDGLHCTFEFDKSLDDNFKGEQDNLKKYALENLRFIVDWSEFDVTNTSDDGLLYDLWNIFKRTRSSNIVKYMDDKIKLEIEEKDMVFDNNKSELIKDK